MSQVSSKVNWCLKKAGKEIKEKGEVNIDDSFIDILKVTDVEEVHESSLLQLRENFQYGVEIEFKERIVFDELHDLCKKLINKTRDIIHAEE